MRQAYDYWQDQPGYDITSLCAHDRQAACHTGVDYVLLGRSTSESKFVGHRKPLQPWHKATGITIISFRWESIVVKLTGIVQLHHLFSSAPIFPIPEEQYCSILVSLPKFVQRSPDEYSLTSPLLHNIHRDKTNFKRLIFWGFLTSAW